MTRVPAPLRHISGVFLALVPLLACIASGAIHASLWLDEILYWNFERSTALRAMEMRRPGSHLAPYFMNYFYCDIQRVVHAILSAVALTFESDPELFLRFLSIVSFAAIAVFVYAWTFRQSQSWWWSASAALAVAASPLLLFYAFEARMSVFAALGVVLYLAMLATALRAPASPWLLLGGAVFGVFLGHLHAWIVCLYLALCIVAFFRLLFTRQWREFWTVLTFAVPGGLATALEARYITTTYPPGGEGFPLYAPRPLWFLQERTLTGMFSVTSSVSVLLPLLAFIAALLLVCWTVRRSPNLLFPAAAVIALWVSTLVGARFGQMIVPRYQVPLFAALFFSLGFAATRNARLLVTLFAAVQLVLLPNAITDIHSKGNGKQVAAMIETQSPRNRTAVIVQQGLRLGYPDPLHSFALQLYLNEANPALAPMPILELPSLQNITHVQGVRDYFGGGNRLLQQYASSPTAAWQQQLRAAPFDRIWLVTPTPLIQAEAEQSNAFRAVLENSGFTLDPHRLYAFSGYPRTQAGLFVRNAGVAPVPNSR